MLLYRTASGEITALENRCRHRGAPLHLGRREDDCVRCGYHGMKFDASGVCIEVPTQEKVPTRAIIRTYPVVERDEFVWIRMGGPPLDPVSIVREAAMLKARALIDGMLADQRSGLLIRARV